MVGFAVASMAVVSISGGVANAAIKNGAKCTRVGQIVTVKLKKKSTDFICVQQGKKKLWRPRPSGPVPGVTTNTTVPGVTTNTTVPGGTTNTTVPGVTTNTTVPGGTTVTTVPGASSTKTSAVKEVSSSYAILADSPFTRVGTTAAPTGYLSALGLASTTGTALYDHPSGLASNGTNLLLVDRGNNRILVWNIAPTSSSTPPDFVLCQSSTTSTASGSGLNQCNWPSDAVVTSTGKLLVADSDNNRILVWSTMPTTTGQSASYVIDLGADAWPWGVWSNGTKVVATLTGKAQLKIWNSFPSTGAEAADLTLTGNTTNCLGTPRGVTSDGTSIIVGDHNGKCAKSSVAHVFATWPTPSSSAVSYDIEPFDSNFAWPHGSFNSATGKLYLLSKRLVEYSNSLATQSTGTQLATSTDFVGGDGGDVEVVNGYMYVTEYNGNRAAVFRGIPGASSSVTFYLGSPGLDSTTNTVINTLDTNYFITNPQVATLGGAMAINSDFDRKIYVWKSIPATDGAKPDLVWTTQNQNDSNPLLAMDFQPDSSAATTAADGKPLYAAAGEKTFVVWRGIPTKITDVPVLNIKDSIGNVTFSGALRVAADNKYFYILDGEAKKIYVWSGIPADKNDSPDFSISAEVNRIRSDGSWLVGTSLYNTPHVLLWSVSTLGQNAAATGTVSGVEMNLPQDALVSNGVLFVADTGFHRTLAWNSVSSALAGAAPDAYLGATSLTDKLPAHSVTDTRWPASLWVSNGFLWVGERKFGHRVLRYALS